MENKYFLLHQKYSHNASELKSIWQHCQHVWQVCQNLIDQNPQIKFNQKILQPAALLHDIGVYLINKNHLPYIQHFLESAKILKQENFPSPVINAVLHHVGSGISKQEIINQQLPLPKKDFLPTNPTEQLLAYADKFAVSKKTSSSNPSPEQIFQQELQKMQSYSPASAKRFLTMRSLFGLPDL